jgi:hypothetical protein
VDFSALALFYFADIIPPSLRMAFMQPQPQQSTKQHETATQKERADSRQWLPSLPTTIFRLVRDADINDRDTG